MEPFDAPKVEAALEHQMAPPAYQSSHIILHFQKPGNLFGTCSRKSLRLKVKVKVPSAHAC